MFVDYVLIQSNYYYYFQSSMLNIKCNFYIFYYPLVKKEPWFWQLQIQSLTHIFFILNHLEFLVTDGCPIDSFFIAVLLSYYYRKFNLFLLMHSLLIFFLSLQCACKIVRGMKRCIDQVP